MPDQEQPTPDVSGVRDNIEQAVQKRREKKRRQEQAAQQEGGEDPEQLTDEDLQEKAKQRQKIAQVLQRGFVNHRLDPKQHLGDAYDPNRCYEWVRDREEDISRIQALGARIEQKPDSGTPEGTHGTADGRIRVGDVVLVSFSQADYKVIQEVREEKKERRRGENAGRQDYLDKVRSRDAAPAFQPEQR